MIENERRQPTIEMIDQIYDSFHVLTRGEIIEKCTKEEFRSSSIEQAKNFLLLRCAQESIQDHYEGSLNLALSYQRKEVVYHLHYLMGMYYQDEHD